jgi:hypothetical protein
MAGSLMAHSRARTNEWSVATSGAALQRPGAVPREQPGAVPREQPGPVPREQPGALPRERPIGIAAERAHEAPARVSSPTVNRPARAMRHILAGFVLSAILGVVLFAVMLVVHGGWQAAAAGGSIMAGSGALVAFLIVVTVGDRV